MVDAVNQLPNFHVEYPRSRAEQMKIAKGFEEKSEVGFSNCACCIDGLLIWTHKPSEEDAKKAGVGRKNFLCGRKGKFGLNCQAISDVHFDFFVDEDESFRVDFREEASIDNDTTSEKSISSISLSISLP